MSRGEVNQLYHKIQTVYKRDPKNLRTLLEGKFSIPEFEYLAKNTWEWAEKIDGICLDTDYFPNSVNSEKIVLNGKTEKTEIPKELKEKLNQFYSNAMSSKILYNMFETCEKVQFFMEGYGNKIQSGGKYRKDQGFVLFDVCVDGWWLERENVEDIANRLHMEIAPIIGWGNLYEMIEFVRKGFYSKWGPFFAEGVVARPLRGLRTRGGDRIITKIKYKDFLRK